MSKGRILIVDDEPHVTQAITDLLQDDNFEVVSVADGIDAMSHLWPSPDIVLLELWLPGQDGMALLQTITANAPNSSVIAMSGHGNIALAMQAAKMGAVDFIEKPFQPTAIIEQIRRFLQPEVTSSTARPQVLPPPSHDKILTGRVLSSSAPHFASTLRQRTLAQSVVVRGQGLQSGLKTAIQLSPLPPGSGILFRNIATGQTMPAKIDAVTSTAFCTSLCQASVIANTIEHLMSALHAYRLSNLLVTLHDEIPIMDGSSLDFCHWIEKAGILEQDAEAESFVVEECYLVGHPAPETKFIMVEPYDGFRITYRVQYPEPIGVEEWTYEHHSGATYLEQIAPARTFAFVEDVETMQEAGLIPGGRLTNVILIGKSQIVNRTPMRFANEFVRHKILDIIGDLYLFGMPIRGHVRANMTGHTENVALVQALQNASVPVS